MCLGWGWTRWPSIFTAAHRGLTDWCAPIDALKVVFLKAWTCSTSFQHRSALHSFSVPSQSQFVGAPRCQIVTGVHSFLRGLPGANVAPLRLIISDRSELTWCGNWLLSLCQNIETSLFYVRRCWTKTLKFKLISLAVFVQHAPIFECLFLPSVAAKNNPASFKAKRSYSSSLKASYIVVSHVRKLNHHWDASCRYWSPDHPQSSFLT